VQDKCHAVHAAADAVPAGSSQDDAACCIQSGTTVPQSEPEGAAAEDMQLDYKGAPAPVCELNRIKHLHDLNIMYTRPEQRFDDLTHLCTLVFKVKGTSFAACIHACKRLARTALVSKVAYQSVGCGAYTLATYSSRVYGGVQCEVPLLCKALLLKCSLCTMTCSNVQGHMLVADFVPV
jgi:hypothetical protein